MRDPFCSAPRAMAGLDPLNCPIVLKSPRTVAIAPVQFRNSPLTTALGPAEQVILMVTVLDTFHFR